MDDLHSQSPKDEQPAKGERREIDYDARHRRNLAAVIFLLVLAIVAVFVVNRLDAQKRLQRCHDSGRKDCFAVSPP